MTSSAEKNKKKLKLGHKICLMLNTDIKQANSIIKRLSTIPTSTLSLEVPTCLIISSFHWCLIEAGAIISVAPLLIGS